VHLRRQLERLVSREPDDDPQIRQFCVQSCELLFRERLGEKDQRLIAGVGLSGDSVIPDRIRHSTGLCASVVDRGRLPRRLSLPGAAEQREELQRLLGAEAKKRGPI
jgi:hypothetical protein